MGLDARMSQTSDATLPPKASFKLDRRSLMIGTGLAVVGVLYNLRAPLQLAESMEQASFSATIPKQVAGWTSRKTQEVVLPPQDDSNQLYENLETRIYEGPGLPAIMLLIAYSSKQQNNIHVHRPEVCYPAAGFPILWTRPAQIAVASTSLEARELLADRGGLRERIVYWIRIGHAFPTSWAQQRVAMAVQNLQGTVPDGALFRVSAIEEPDTPSSEAIMNFIEAFLTEVSPGFRDSILL
jgi:EpsI family protein